MLIACATDHNYVELTGVLIASLAKNGDAAGGEFVLFGAGLTRRDKDRLRACAANGLTVTFVDLDDVTRATLGRLQTKRHITPVAYVCMMMPDLIPERTGRLVYLDCDIVVNRSLAPLAALDLGGRPLAAVHIDASPATLAAANAEIGRGPEEPFFNSGVLVVDMDEWRRRGLTARCMDYAINRSGPIRFHDQDVLNHVVGRDWLALDPSWNTGVEHLTREECERPALLHYKGKVKPFHRDFDLPALAIYDRFRALTPWAHARRVSKGERRLRQHWKGIGKSLRRAFKG